MSAYFKQKRTIVNVDESESSREEQEMFVSHHSNETPSQWLSRMNSEDKLSRTDSFFQATARCYIPYTRQLSTVNRHRNFRRLLSYDDQNQTPRFLMHGDELKRFSLAQVRDIFLLVIFITTMFYLGSSCFSTSQC